MVLNSLPAIASSAPGIAALDRCRPDLVQDRVDEAGLHGVDLVVIVTSVVGGEWALDRLACGASVKTPDSKVVVEECRDIVLESV